MEYLNYQKPKIKFIDFEQADVITVSCGWDCGPADIKISMDDSSASNDLYSLNDPSN